MQGLYKHNVCPVSTKTLQFDDETLLPPNTKRKAGRPKKARYRSRSKFPDPKDSLITCSLCRRRGHNRKTCLRRTEEEQVQQETQENYERRTQNTGTTEQGTTNTATTQTTTAGITEQATINTATTQTTTPQVARAPSQTDEIEESSEEEEHTVEKNPGNEKHLKNEENY